VLLPARSYECGMGGLEDMKMHRFCGRSDCYNGLTIFEGKRVVLRRDRFAHCICSALTFAQFVS